MEAIYEGKVPEANAYHKTEPLNRGSIGNDLPLLPNPLEELCRFIFGSMHGFRNMRGGVAPRTPKHRVLGANLDDGAELNKDGPSA